MCNNNNNNNNNNKMLMPKGKSPPPSLIIPFVSLTILSHFTSKKRGGRGWGIVSKKKRKEKHINGRQLIRRFYLDVHKPFYRKSRY